MANYIESLNCTSKRNHSYLILLISSTILFFSILPTYEFYKLITDIGIFQNCPQTIGSNRNDYSVHIFKLFKDLKKKKKRTSNESRKRFVFFYKVLHRGGRTRAVEGSKRKRERDTGGATLIKTRTSTGTSFVQQPTSRCFDSWEALKKKFHPASRYIPTKERKTAL